MAVIAGDVVNPNFNDPHQDPHRPERWADGLKLIEDFPDRAAEVSELPLMMQATSRLTARSESVSRLIGTVVLRYRF